MIKYNLYKIKKSQETQLVRKLLSVGLEKISELEENEFTFSFYFSPEPDKINIWWTEAYADFFGNSDIPQNRVYFAALIISNAELCYGVSLGKSHFYFKPFCDQNFGLEIAERISDEKNLKVKNSKFFQSKKSKTISSYQLGSSIDYDIGESTHYLKAKTIDKQLWGKIASFGDSVQLNLEISPLELPSVIERLEQVLTKPPLFRLPKVDEVKDEVKIQELDYKLANAIKASDKNSNINIEEFSVSGVNFIFSDTNDFSLYLPGIGEKFRVNELTVANLLHFIKSNNLDIQKEINDIKVQVHNEYGRDYSKRIKHFLDFIDDQESYCLIDGKWHRFNQSYLNFLKKEVDSIEFAHDDKYDSNEDITEDKFNKEREALDGFVCYDKVLESIDGKYKIEKMDLYKEAALYFVKRGTPQKLNYVIDQAITTVKILQNRESKIEINGQEEKIKNIVIWIILNRKTPINLISDINSMIFHMKLVDWKKIVLNAGYQPQIKINYTRAV